MYGDLGAIVANYASHQNNVIIWTGQAANSAVNHLCEQFASYVSRTRINCPAVHVLFKPYSYKLSRGSRLM